jgi:tRNA-dihydrouridine synthase A
MLDWTDRHERFFLRLISQNVLLYSEMIVSEALLNANHPSHLLSFNHEEHPIALQVAGNNPKSLAECAVIAEDYGYDSINLNIGCPSPRVQSGKIGACLMNEPERVAESLFMMKKASQLPVSIKHRIGIDDDDSYDFLKRFVAIIEQSGCHLFIIHARKAILSGLSPKENRSIPPLIYDRVYQLKKDFPHLTFVLNGGIKTLDACQDHLKHIDGVMMGREAYHNPYILSQVDELFYLKVKTSSSRIEIAEQMIPYIEKHVALGGKVQHITRHMLGLFHAQKNAQLWRRYLSTHSVKSGATAHVIKEALEFVR